MAVGKSSVVKAGVIPALREGALPNSENWFIAETVPGTDPFFELKTSLLRVATHATPNLGQQLESENGFHSAIHQILPDDNSELVLIIDQFEELFTLTDDDDMSANVISPISSMPSHTHKVASV